MLFLQSHHITDLYCAIDDLVPKMSISSQGGRPAILSNSELLTILIWNAIVLRQKTIKDLYQTICIYHCGDFPKLPKYRGFVSHCHRLIPICLELLNGVLSDEEPIRIMDATMLPVCKLQRANSHKVTKKISAFGKNYQGWHYGFKLHASIDLEGSLCGVALTPANIYDAQAMTKTLNRHAKIAVGDTLYGARVMGQIIKERYGTIIIAPPHPKQKKKIITGWQYFLLRSRSKIESVFDYLKEHMNLVSSFPRSVAGYLFHYIRILLSYQMMHFLSRA